MSLCPLVVLLASFLPAPQLFLSLTSTPTSSLLTEVTIPLPLLFPFRCPFLLRLAYFFPAPRLFLSLTSISAFSIKSPSIFLFYFHHCHTEDAIAAGNPSPTQNAGSSLFPQAITVSGSILTPNRTIPTPSLDLGFTNSSSSGSIRIYPNAKPHNPTPSLDLGFTKRG